MRHRTLSVIVLALALGACSDEGDPTDPGAGDALVTYSGTIQPIFNTRCTDHHGPGGSGGLNLREGSSYDNLVGKNSTTYSAPRVAVGDPDASVLYNKVAGTGVFGQQMPAGETPLSSAQIEAIRTWIAEGAKPD
jgi:hypothetical protein